MKPYTLAELADPATYDADSDLATFARKVAGKTHADGSMPFGDWKRQYLAGLHAEAVYAALNEHREAARLLEEEATRALFARNAKIEKALSELADKIPTGITLDVSETGLTIQAPWDDGDLAKRLKRVGGEWNRAEKRFDVPITAAPSLARIFTNWHKVQKATAIKAAKERAATLEEKALRQARESLRYAAEKKARDAAKRKERRERKQNQEQAKAERRQVVVGEYQVGDMLGDKKITGFGKSWSESTLSGGQLWQECSYGSCQVEPVCVHCEKCRKHCACGQMIEVCYAYFR